MTPDEPVSSTFFSSISALITAPKPTPVLSMTAQKGGVLYPLPGLVTSTAKRLPLGPTTALAVAPVPPPPQISQTHENLRR